MLVLILHTAFLATLSIWLWRKEEAPLRRLYWPALSVKIIAGIALGIIYSTYYQTSDTFIFFKLAAEKADLAKTDFSNYLEFLFSRSDGYFLGEHRTVFFTRITSIFALLSNNNYWLAAVWFSWFSFIAAWYLTKTISQFFPDYRIAACVAFLFFPSVVFWSSGIIKESLAMAGLFFLTAIFLQVWMRSRVSIVSLLLAILCIWFIFNLKYFYLAVFIPITIAALLARWISGGLKITRASGQIIVWIGLLVCGFLLVTFLHPNFSPSKLLNIIVSTNTLFMEVCTPDDVIHYHNLEPSWGSMLLNSPWALISGFFRPFIWEANTIFKFITAIENLFLLIFFIFSVRSWSKIIQSQHCVLILSAILYCALLSIFLALSTPNFGTLARYGVGFLPFLVLLLANQPFLVKPLSKVL